MKTIGDNLTAFAITGVKPGQPADHKHDHKHDHKSHKVPGIIAIPIGAFQ